jgi:hypothetical protein
VAVVSPLASLAATFVVLGLAGCSTGVAEADRAIFVNACAATAGATEPDCGCAYDELNRRGSERLLADTLDELRNGRVPARVTRAVARCSTQG